MTDWSPPSELLQPLPRRVRMKRGYKYAQYVGPILVLGIVMMALFLSFLGARQMEILKRRGVSAEGHVTGLRAESNRGGSINYSVEYRFLPGGAEGRREHYYVWNSSVSRSEFEALQIGQSVGVIYAPDRPDNSALEMTVDAKSNHPYQRLMHLAASLVLGLGGVSLVSIACTYGIYHRQKRLALWGAAAEAVIVSERRVRFGQGRTTEVTYQFRDDTGSIKTGKRLGAPVKSSSFNSRFPAASTQTVTVLYDPAKSSRNMLYPSSVLIVSAPKTTQVPA